MMPFIVSIVGAPGAGKTFLTQRLSLFLNAVPITEPEPSTYPEFVQAELAKGIQTVETFKWFRRLAVESLENALSLKSQGKNVLLDTFWACNELYLDAFFLKEIEHSACKEIAKEDVHRLKWPDLVVYLKTSNEKIAELSKKRSREYESPEILEKYYAVNDAHDAFFSKTPKTLTINRDALDFEKNSDVKDVAQKILEQII